MHLYNLVRESQYHPYMDIHMQMHMSNLLTVISYHVVLVCAHVICQEEQFETNKKMPSRIFKSGICQDLIIVN